jgi:hypothetical protein
MPLTVEDRSEAGLAGHPDENLFGYPLRDDRILLTHDEDFLNDRKFPLDPNRNPGVIVLPGARGGDSILLNALRLALRFICDSRELYRGAKVWISATGVFTIRERDLETGRILSWKVRINRKRLEQWVDEEADAT